MSQTMVSMACATCGGGLKETGDHWHCPYCGRDYWPNSALAPLACPKCNQIDRVESVETVSRQDAILAGRIGLVFPPLPGAPPKPIEPQRYKSAPALFGLVGVILIACLVALGGLALGGVWLWLAVLLAVGLVLTGIMQAGPTLWPEPFMGAYQQALSRWKIKAEEADRVERGKARVEAAWRESLYCHRCAVVFWPPAHRATEPEKVTRYLMDEVGRTVA